MKPASSAKGEQSRWEERQRKLCLVISGYLLGSIIFFPKVGTLLRRGKKTRNFCSGKFWHDGSNSRLKPSSTYLYNTRTCQDLQERHARTSNGSVDQMKEIKSATCSMTGIQVP